MSRHKKHFPLLAFSLSLLISLGVLEVVLRIIAPLEVTSRMYQYSRPVIQCLFSRYDNLLGWSSPPNGSFRFKSADFDTEVKTNSEGFRDDEFTEKKEPPKIRVALMGDSFAFGWGVEKKQAFADIIEQVSEGEVEVFNFGVSGYSTLQEVLLFEKSVIPKKPDIAVLAFYDNDPRDNMEGFARPHMVLENGTFKINSDNVNFRYYNAFTHQDKAYLHDGLAFYARRGVKIVKTFFRTHSYAYNLISSRLKQFKKADPMKGGGKIVDKEVWMAEQKLLNRFIRDCKKADIIPFIAIMPNKMEIKPSVVKALGSPFPNPYRRAVKEYCRIHNISMLDVTETLRDDQKEKYHFPLDDHLTAFGHEDYGKRLAYALQRQALRHHLMNEKKEKINELLENSEQK